MPIAKVIKNRGSQAIRLLKEFRVKNARVYLKKTADGFIVLECDPWEVFEEAAQRLSPEFVDVVQNDHVPSQRLVTGRVCLGEANTME